MQHVAPPGQDNLRCPSDNHRTAGVRRALHDMTEGLLIPVFNGLIFWCHLNNGRCRCGHGRNELAQHTSDEAFGVLIVYLSLLLRDPQFTGHPCHKFVVNQVPVQTFGKTSSDLAAAATVLARNRDRLHFSSTGLNRTHVFLPFCMSSRTMCESLTVRCSHLTASHREFTPSL